MHSWPDHALSCIRKCFFLDWGPNKWLAVRGSQFNHVIDRLVNAIESPMSPAGAETKHSPAGGVIQARSLMQCDILVDEVHDRIG